MQGCCTCRCPAESYASTRFVFINVLYVNIIESLLFRVEFPVSSHPVGFHSVAPSRRTLGGRSHQLRSHRSSSGGSSGPGPRPPGTGPRPVPAPVCAWSSAAASWKTVKSWGSHCFNPRCAWVYTGGELNVYRLLRVILVLTRRRDRSMLRTGAYVMCVGFVSVTHL